MGTSFWSKPVVQVALMTFVGIVAASVALQGRDERLSKTPSTDASGGDSKRFDKERIPVVSSGVLGSEFSGRRETQRWSPAEVLGPTGICDGPLAGATPCNIMCGLDCPGARPAPRGIGCVSGSRGRSDIRIITGNFTVVGGLSREVVGEVIRRHANQVKSCYERELVKNPLLRGTVEIAFQLDGSGSVVDPQVSRDLEDNRAVSQCLVSRMRRWRFPEPNGGEQVVVTCPWSFSVKGGD